MQFITGCLFLFVLFSALLALLTWIRRRWHVHPEVCRKAIHIAMGMACLTFPAFVLTIWQTLFLAVLFTGSLALLRFTASPVIARFDVFRATRCKSAGEFYFVAGIALALILAGGDRFAYFASVLLLAFADAGAGAIGLLSGKIRCWGNSKTLEGSIAFAMIGILCLIFVTATTGKNPGLVICSLVCLISTVTEGLATRIR